MGATKSHTRTASLSTPTIALVSNDVYSVMNDDTTLGYIHKVGPVYVALSGDVLSHAVEVGQSLNWDQAVNLVRAAAH
ncbi:MAG: hypothetical protein ABWY54_06835 [Glaciihabitans sp.]